MQEIILDVICPEKEEISELIMKSMSNFVGETDSEKLRADMRKALADTLLDSIGYSIRGSNVRVGADDPAPRAINVST